MAITNTDFQTVAVAISAYAKERYTFDRRLNSTGLVTTSMDISTDGEGFTGQMRWYKPVAATINTPSMSSATDGTYSSISTVITDYIKAARTVGIQQVNLQQLISKEDGLKYFAESLSETRAQNEHEAVLSVLKGVAASEAAVGAGVVAFDTTPSGSVGAFVDVNALGEFGAAATGSGDARALIDTTATGAAKGERLFRAMGMFWKDYEPEYVYMVTSPEAMADLRGANLVDTDRIVDGNMSFQTLFGGKFRLLLTRATQGDLSASGNVNDQSTKTTFLVAPGAISFKSMEMPVPLEIQRTAASYSGGGSTDLWYRFGYVAHPLGYNWAGATSAFASNAALATGASWERVADPLNLGVLPIFHS